VIAGMHRSGTSFIASVLAAAGLAVGERLVAPDANNPHGYFEDLDFVELNQRILHACTREGEPGHRDWGWTESERLDRGRLSEHRAAALALVERRLAGPEAAGAWGFKDPRTTVLLDFWHEALAEAEANPRYLLLYRAPWDVADALQRLGADVFLANPEYAYRIWTFYNRQLLDFHRRHRQRSLLVAIRAVLADPAGFTALLAARFGLRVGSELPGRLFAGDGLLTRAGDDPLIGLVAATSPEAVRLLGELDREADLPGSGTWRQPPPLAAPAVRREPPVASVIVPCFDHGELLVEAVASVESNAPGCELIVVNDGSRQPRTLAVLEVLRRAGYQVLDQENAGLAAARNAGIARARGRHVLPLDADDRLGAGFLAAAVALLDAEPAVGVVYGDRREFGRRARVVEVPEFDLDRLLAGNYIASCALVRKAAWEKSGGYDEKLAAWEDWELWISLAAGGWELRHLAGVAFDHRIRPGSMVTRCERGEVGEPLQGYIVRKHQALYLARLPHLLIATQRALSAQQDLAGRVAALGVERDLLGVERDLLRESRDRAADGCRSRDARLADLTAERDRLYRELGAWQARVEFMESTRSWRLRETLLRLRHAAPEGHRQPAHSAPATGE
jgi:hypothetical protein